MDRARFGASLRACDLDQLIKALYDNYAELKQLQTTIIPVAEGLLDPEEHLQAASVIIKTLSPFYK
ncbi:MAG: hypothetical protein HC796_10840 [Synechococcaceae cyanobacterium RL_1_2]|nr:hypothetical protein [Synechococcaceae cyanobacterium RL_1_2]